MALDHLASPPFNLDREAIAWGRSAFERNGPIDPLCGLEDAHF